VTSADYQVTLDNENATILATLKIEAPEENGATSESHQRWEFSLRQANGWRVCSAHQVD
jgi:hypothetical protein